MGKTYLGDSNDLSAAPKRIYIGDENNESVICKAIYVGNGNGKSVEVFRNTALPAAYQKVEYILNTGHTQYIDVGLKPDSNTRIELTFKLVGEYLPSTYGEYLSSLFSANNQGGYGRMDVSVYAVLDNYNYWDITVTYNVDDVEISLGKSDTQTIHVLDYNRPGGYFYLDDELKMSSIKTFAAVNANLNLYAFVTSTGSVASYTEFNTYRMRVWQNNAMIRDMYPCYRKADTEVGMYDLVNNVFYTNAGTGIFYKGPDV